MELTALLEQGATLIQDNSDDATSDLETGSIVDALMNLLGDGEGGLNLSTFVSGFSAGGLGAIAASWLGSGENSAISSEQISELFGTEKITEFASSLGLSEESATGALSDALPSVIDKFTSGEGSIVDQMLDKVGGASGAMDMLSKMFR